MENYLGQNIPKLGFGYMRLPMKDKQIDIEATNEMVDMFMQNGFNYFDTAYVYNDGESEKAIKKTVVERYPRDKFLLASKLPAWAAKSKEEALAMFNTSLERCGVEYFDFFLLHNLGENRDQYFDKYDVWNFLSKMKAEGKIKHLGFSIHDNATVLDEVLTKHPEMEFVQLQINYADWEHPWIESRRCLEIAEKHQKPVIVMEPVRGGALANPLEEIKELFKKENSEASFASWAIRFAASQKNIITVLSGMSNIEQMNDNISFMKQFKPLTENEMKTIKLAEKIYSKAEIVPCTSCAYCMKGCPENIAIYGTFQAYNSYKTYDNLELAKGNYSWNTSGHGWEKASSCVECGACSEVCPQHIDIIAELKKCVLVLEK